MKMKMMMNHFLSGHSASTAPTCEDRSLPTIFLLINDHQSEEKLAWSTNRLSIAAAVHQSEGKVFAISVPDRSSI